MSISHNMDKAKELKSNPFKIQNKMEKEQDIIQKMIDTVTKKEEASNVIEVLNQDFEGLLLKTKDPIQAWIRGTILKKLQFNNAGDLFLAKAAELGYVVESASINESVDFSVAKCYITDTTENDTKNLLDYLNVHNMEYQYLKDVFIFKDENIYNEAFKVPSHCKGGFLGTSIKNENILPDTNLMENNTIFNKVVAKYTLSDVLKSQLSNVVKNYDTDKEETIKAIAAITSDSEDNIKTLINENVEAQIVETTETTVESPTDVVFYIDTDGQPLAVFPNEVADSKGNIGCYAHVGQHSACNRDYLINLKEAQPTEYVDLANELRGLNYNLNILNETATFENFKQQFMYNPNEVNPVKEQDENAVVEKPLDYNPRALKYLINDDAFLKFSYHNLGTYDEAKDLDLIYNTYIKGDDAMEAKLKTYESYTASLKESVIESNPGFKRIF